MSIVRLADIPWEDRVNTDGWPCRAGTYYDDRDSGLCLRLIDYPKGSIEPRHVHPGMHATTVLKNRAIVDGLTLGPLDVILGPSNEPHGPLDYADGCYLLSAFIGSFFHSEVETLSAEKQYRLIRHADIPWTPLAGGGDSKVLVDRGVGPLLVEAFRLPAGTQLRPAFLAGLLVAGKADAGGEALGAWDMVLPDADTPPLSAREDATLLAFTLRETV
ncbi:MAG: hypothetical protein VW644_08085 [Alphaproteobacteria bacterium]|jgi:hypothetical protein